MIIIDAMKKVRVRGVRVGGELLKSIKFANDQWMISQTESGRRV